MWYNSLKLIFHVGLVPFSLDKPEPAQLAATVLTVRTEVWILVGLGATMLLKISQPQTRQNQSLFQFNKMGSSTIWSGLAVQIPSMPVCRSAPGQQPDPTLP